MAPSCGTLCQLQLQLQLQQQNIFPLWNEYGIINIISSNMYYATCNLWLLKILTFKKANIYKSRIVSVCVNVDFFSSALTQRGEGQAN